jgi:hypothetical protein
MGVQTNSVFLIIIKFRNKICKCSKFFNSIIKIYKSSDLKIGKWPQLYTVSACSTNQFRYRKSLYTRNSQIEIVTLFNFFPCNQLLELIRSICYNFKFQLSKLLQSISNSNFQLTALLNYNQGPML